MTRIGFIGLGDIGAPMARRVLHKHGSVVAWNRSPEKLAALVAEGATPASSPAQVMDACDMVGLCLTSHAAVEAVAFGPDGLVDGAAAGKLVVDHSTGSPHQAKLFAAQAMACGFGWVDAPVSGGVAGAEAGELILFAGGAAEDIARAEPLTSAFAARVTHMGEAGAGQTTKLFNQMLVACGVMGFAEMIAAARKAGVNVERLPEALAGGFADSRPFQIFGPRMATGAFTPRLGALGLMEKDLGLACAISKEAGADTPLSDLCLSLYRRASDPDADLSTVIRLFEGVP